MEAAHSNQSQSVPNSPTGPLRPYLANAIHFWETAPPLLQSRTCCRRDYLAGRHVAPFPPRIRTSFSLPLLASSP